MFQELTWSFLLLLFLFLCVFVSLCFCQDVATGMCTPLLAVASCGVTLIKWSPSGHYVFAATLSKVVRVWETKTWTGERWYTYRCGVLCFILFTNTVLLTLLLFLLNIFFSIGFVLLLLLLLFFFFLVLLLFLLLLSNRTIPTGPCQSACWNPQGTLLLAAVAGCSDIWTFGESGLCF